MPIQSLSRALAATVTLGALAVVPSTPALAVTAADYACVQQQYHCPRPAPHAASSATAEALEARRAQETGHGQRPVVVGAPPATKAPAAAFQWDDAGVGAAGILGLMLAALGGAWSLHRRRMRVVRLSV
jgi:hypothetical protein